MTERIKRRFAELKREGRGGFAVFVTAGDPDRATSLEILRGLPAAGADIIELGMPFTDPMADGPAIQASSLRALKAGATLQSTLDLVGELRRRDDTTPVVLMGYFNPIYSYGVERFLGAAKAAGVDGLIIVDLPPEEDEELCLPALKAGLAFIRLATPTTDDKRLPTVLAHTAGFVYYVAITGITGTASADNEHVTRAVKRLKRATDLPIVAGFGIRTPEQAAAVARVADAAAVGTAVVQKVAEYLDASGNAKPGLVEAVLGLVGNLADAVRNARQKEPAE